MIRQQIYVGDIFYSKDNFDKVILLRVIKIVNENKFSVMCDGKRFNITYENLANNYIKLKHHGSIFFSIVNMTDNNQDVIISFFRREDEGTNKLPYAICRQMIENTFMSKAKLMNNTGIEDPNFYIGMSISQDTCPEDLPFDMMLACDKVTLSNRINIYINDTFEDIVELIPKIDKYNSVIKNIQEKSRGSVISGTNSGIIELLKSTIFMQDVCMGFNIKLLNYTLQYNKDSLELIPEQRKDLEYIINQEMFRTYVIPYNFTINLNEIKRSYVLVKDINEDLYIVAYDKGEYINKDMRKDFREKLDSISSI